MRAQSSINARSTYDVYQGMLFDLTPNQITQVRRPPPHIGRPSVVVSARGSGHE
jgi:hypothetical protein